MIYVFHDGEYFATVNDNLEIRRVKDINRASYWTEKRTTKSCEKNQDKPSEDGTKNAGLTLIEK